MSIQVTFIGHACVIIEISGIRILCDPHLHPTFSSGLFTYFPARDVDIAELPNPDLIFISHRHRDHYNLASLALLDRSVPVICAADLEILYGLEKLGFKDINPITDWEEISLENVTLVFTPSLYRVPEHGLLALGESGAVWNMVDTMIDHAEAIRCKRRIGARKLDLLLWPYQPLMETHAPTNRLISFPVNHFRRQLEVVRVLQPKAVVPYSDGQFGVGGTAWLNHFKFPVSSGNGAAAARWVAPDCEIFEPHPGGIISIDQGTIAKRGSAPFVKAIASSPADRQFDTTQQVPPLSNHNLPGDLKLTWSIEELTQRILKAWRKIGGDKSLQPYLQASARWRVTYRILLVTEEVNHSVELSFQCGKESESRAHGRRTTEDNYAQVRVLAGVLQAIFEARLHFVAAFLSGLLRSSEMVYRVTKNGVETPLILRDGTKEEPEHADTILCPVTLLNHLVGSQASIARSVVDREIERSLADHEQR